jgi:hypothetical protein
MVSASKELQCFFLGYLFTYDEVLRAKAVLSLFILNLEEEKSCRNKYIIHELRSEFSGCP